jgi:hypothetical protein
LAVFSLAVFLLTNVYCGGGLENGEVKRGTLIPRIKHAFSSDEVDSPYFFAAIKDIRSNKKFIYVADWKSLKITIFDHDFNLIKKFGKRGSGPGEFDYFIVDLYCTDNNLYVLTLKKVIEFTAEGDYIREFIPKYRVRRLFKIENGFLFKRDFFPVTFTKSDLDGEIIENFFDTQKITSPECGKAYVAPSVHLTLNNKILAMSSTTYKIRQFDLETKQEEFNISRDTPFWALHCEDRGEGKFAFSGGFSSMLEGENNYRYYYHISETKIGIDVYRKSDFTLHGIYTYDGKIYPRAYRITHRDFLGSIVEEGDTLYLFELIEVPSS